MNLEKSVKIVIINHGDVLATKVSNGYDIFGVDMEFDESPSDAAIRILETHPDLGVTRLERILNLPFNIFKGCTVFEGVKNDLIEFNPYETDSLSYVKLNSILSGDFGLFARYIFNEMKMIDWPILEVGNLYDISKNDEIMDGIVLISNEFYFLHKFNKNDIIIDFIKSIDITLLHPEIISFILTFIGYTPEIKDVDEFIKCSNEYLDEVDLLVLDKHKLIDLDTGNIISEDVKNDSIKRSKERFKKHIDSINCS
ncbi:MAG TPA: hypothetical protein ENI61_04575 [Ignavibacteria bacterium]|nr:hypothetical protein [Ignavibacteria bacterium]